MPSRVPTGVGFALMSALYRLVLAVYPADFRRHLGPSIRRDFRSGWSSSNAPMRFALREIADATANLLPERIDELRAPRKAPGAPPAPRQPERSSYMETFLQDVRHALRSLIKSPVVTGVAVLTLAVGIGANAAVFGIVDGVLLQPLPYRDGDQLTYLSESVRVTGSRSVSWLNYTDWRAMNETFDDMAARSYWGGTMTGVGDPQLLGGMLMTPNLLPMLGVEPVLGRGFTEQEGVDGGVVMISAALWQTSFGGADEVIGRTIQLDEQSYVVVGVMPPGLEFPLQGYDLWGTFAEMSESRRSNRSSHPGISVIGRLRPDVTLEEARRDMDRVGALLAAEYPQANAEAGVYLSALREELVEGSRSALTLLYLAVSIVLLIACVNVANLLLARAHERQAEVALHAALGAGRQRLLRRFIIEPLLLSLAGAVGGIMLAQAMVAAFIAAEPPGIPRLENIAVDGGVLAFTIVVATICGVAFGLLPSWRASAADPAEAFRRGGARGRTGAGGAARHALVVAEVALAFVLVVGAGLMIRSVANLLEADSGFDADGVWVTRIGAPRADYPASPDRALFYDELMERIGALPGVQAVAGVEPLPLSGTGRQNYIDEQGFEGLDETARYFDQMVATPGYFELMGIRLVAGEVFSGEETMDNPVVVIDELLAERLYGGESAVGRRFKFRGDNGPWVTVLGVVDHVKHYGVTGESRGQVYIPHRLQVATLNIVVDAGGNNEALPGMVRTALDGIAPNVPFSYITTMDELSAASIANETLVSRALAIFGGAALALALLGMYGVISFAVSRRTREIGIRRALGARGDMVVAGVLRHALALTTVGVAIGVGLTLLAGSLLESLLYEVATIDTIAMILATLAMAVVAVVAALIPARRAAAVDPTIALSSE